jgi:hypothetical protein
MQKMHLQAKYLMIVGANLVFALLMDEVFTYLIGTTNMTHPEFSWATMERRGVLLPEGGEGSTETIQTAPGVVGLPPGAMRPAQ